MLLLNQTLNNKERLRIARNLGERELVILKLLIRVNATPLGMRKVYLRNSENYWHDPSCEDLKGKILRDDGPSSDDDSELNFLESLDKKGDEINAAVARHVSQ